METEQSRSRICHRKNNTQPLFHNLSGIIINNLNEAARATFLNLSKPKTSIMTEELQSQIEELQASLTGDLFQDMETRDKIHNLEMKLNGVKPESSEFECVGCGS